MEHLSATGAEPDLTALAGARICHDLVNPLGAIGNGLELLQLTTGPSEEMALIADALENATARLNLFRIAFGVGEPDRAMLRPEIERVFEALNRGGRIALSWLPEGDSTRAEGKRVFLAMLCAEAALPLGGTITYTGAEVIAEGTRLKIDETVWGPLANGQSPGVLTSNQVQFALLPLTLQQQGRQLDIAITPERITLAF